MAQKIPQRPKPTPRSKPLNEGSSKGNTRNISSNRGRQAPPPPPPKPRSNPPKR